MNMFSSFCCFCDNFQFCKLCVCWCRKLQLYFGKAKQGSQWVNQFTCVCKNLYMFIFSSHAHTHKTFTLTNTCWGRLALLYPSTCSAEGERSAHLSSLKSRCDSKFFRPLWDGRSCYSSQDGGQGSGCLMIEEKRSKFILLRALCQVPVAYRWEPLTHHRVTAPEVTSTAINLPRLLAC